MVRRRSVLLGAGAAALAGIAPARAAERKLGVTHYGALAYGIPVGVAWHGGYFAQAGVPLDGLLTADGGGTAVRNTLASDLPVGESGIYAIMAARRAGMDLVVIYAAIGSVADSSWVVRADSPVRSINDLAGGKLTYTQPKSGSETQIREVVRVAGLTGKVELVAAGGIREGLAMVEQGAATAAPIVEPLRSALADRFRPVIAVQDYLPRSAQIVGFTSRAFADRNGALLRGIIAARARGYDLLSADPAAAAKLVASDYKLPPDAMERTIRLLAKQDFWSRGEMDIALFRAAEPLMAQVGATDGAPVDWTRVLDDRFLPAEKAG